MGRREVELADCIKILDRYFEQQFGKGSNFYKQAWLPVKRASKRVELSTTAPNTDSPKLPTVEECICEVRRRMLGSEYSEGIPAMVTILHDFICRQLRASA